MQHIDSMREEEIKEEFHKNVVKVDPMFRNNSKDLNKFLVVEIIDNGIGISESN